MTYDFDQSPKENDYPEKKVTVHNNFHVSGFINILSAIVTCVATAFIAVYTIRLSESTELIQQISKNQAATMVDQSVIMAKQSSSIDQSLKQTEKLIEISKSQAAASVEQSQAAEIANYQSENYAKKQIRAYIVFESFDNNQYHPNLNAKNVGQTPAIDLTFHLRVMLAEIKNLNRILELDIDNSTTENNPSSSVNILGSGISQAFSVLNVGEKYDGDFKEIDKFTEKNISDFVSGRRVLWISGVFFYKDIFKELHSTRLCFYFEEGNLSSRTACNRNNDMQ